MQALKTKAIVIDKGQLELLDSHVDLEKGSIVEVIILYQKHSITKTNWQSILNSISTYTEEELLDFAEARTNWF